MSLCRLQQYCRTQRKTRYTHYVIIQTTVAKIMTVAILDTFWTNAIQLSVL